MADFIRSFERKGRKRSWFQPSWLYHAQMDQKRVERYRFIYLMFCVRDTQWSCPAFAGLTHVWSKNLDKVMPTKYLISILSHEKCVDLRLFLKYLKVNSRLNFEILTSSFLSQTFFEVKILIFNIQCHFNDLKND